MTGTPSSTPPAYSARSSPSCGTKSIADTIGSEPQPLPTEGPLADRMGWNLDRLTQETRRAPQRPVYPYVIASLRRDPGGRFEQHGSGPNFQGGVITLCTCKHELRSRKAFRHPAGVWVAGLSPASGTPRRRHLFYLMLVGSRADSQSDMWELLEIEAREAKNARRHRLGDLYEPRRAGLTGAERFISDNYVPPRLDHSHACGRVDEWA